MRFSHTSRRWGLLLTALVTGALALTLTAASRGTTRPPTELSVKIHNFAVTLSTRTLPAGLTRLHVSTGRGTHALMLARLHPHITLAQFKRALGTKDGLDALALASFQGGVDDLPHGRAWDMDTNLRPGTYAVVDQADTGSKPNFDRGALTSLQVTPGPRKTIQAPIAQASIGMVDFAFRIHMPASFHGHGWVRFDSHGRNIHRIILLRLNPSVSYAQAYAAVHAGDESTPPPGEPIELIGAVSPGFIGYLNLHLPRGRYVAACFEADRRTHLVPQTQLGMIGHFEIR